MFVPILATKLYIPSPRPKVILRPHLVERLNTALALGCKLALISAPAGFGKTSLVSEWVAEREQQPEPSVAKPLVRTAWLSLDEGDNDPARFLTYLIAALQTLAPQIGAGVLAALQAAQPPPVESILTSLLNEIAVLSSADTITIDWVLVLDDYHVIDSKPVDEALTFLLDHLPPHLHLIITTREDPRLPLARYRARGHLIELRAADLRFTPGEAAEFLNRVMGLNLSADDIRALETRTEGWIAGLQLAALSMQGRKDVSAFIQSFTGSHHFVLDYLVEEVLEKQPESTLIFLLRTSILDRLCGPLCDAVLGIPSASGLETAGKETAGKETAGKETAGQETAGQETVGQETAGQETRGQKTLEYLERANLFTVPLDDERHWYRYHHLFGNLLRQRLGQNRTPQEIAELHIRASQWFENNGLMLEAFRHAAAANAVERAERLMESRAMGLHLRSVSSTILNWLETLPSAVLDARPLLRVRSATLALMTWRMAGVEEKLQAAEAAVAVAAAADAAFGKSEPDARIRDLTGQIACARATLALTRYDTQTMFTQARRALAYLHPQNHTFLFTANWAFATANLLQGDRAAAAQACQQAIAESQKSGSVFSRMLATNILGNLQKMDNHLHQAAETYQRVLDLSGDNPIPNAGQVQLNLAEIYYEWNDLEVAERHGKQSLQLMRQYNLLIDRFILGEVFLARIKLAQGDAAGAAALLAGAERSARQQNFVLRLPDIAAVQVLVLIQQGELAAAAQLAQQHALPHSQARVRIAQGDPAAALAVLEPLLGQMEARGWADERLKTLVLQAVALHLCAKKEPALTLLGEALALAEPDGFIRLFIDEGPPMADLLAAVAAQGIRPDYVKKLLAAFAAEPGGAQSFASDERQAPSTLGPAILADPQTQSARPRLVEPLTPRELDVLRLIAQGLSNHEIGERLFLALDTVKGHNRRIFDKLQVQRRNEAIARARELGIV